MLLSLVNDLARFERLEHQVVASEQQIRDELGASRPVIEALIAWDGEESFALDAVEAMYYEVVSATVSEWVGLERARYRLLRRADDFRWEDETNA